MRGRLLHSASSLSLAIEAYRSRIRFAMTFVNLQARKLQASIVLRMISFEPTPELDLLPHDDLAQMCGKYCRGLPRRGRAQMAFQKSLSPLVPIRVRMK